MSRRYRLISLDEARKELVGMAIMIDEIGTDAETPAMIHIRTIGKEYNILVQGHSGNPMIFRKVQE